MAACSQRTLLRNSQSSRTPVRDLIETVRVYLELIRFSHTLFALPFAALSAAMAWAETPFCFRHLLGFLLCMVFARSTAMAFNRLVDRRIDAINPRTANRHLPRGVLNVGQVIAFTVVCGVAFCLSTLLFLPNLWPVAGALPVLAFLMAYSYAKRFTWLCHFWLGAALALAPIAAWVAITGEFGLPPVVLALAVVFWVAGFDVIYACQDYEFDRTVGLKSLPAWLGIRRALRWAAVLHLGMATTLAFLPLVYTRFGMLYWSALSAIILLLIYEHALVRPNDLSRVNQAFFHVNAIISTGLFIAGVADIWIV